MCIDVIVTKTFYIDTEYCWHSLTTCESLQYVLFIIVQTAYNIQYAAAGGQLHYRPICALVYNLSNEKMMVMHWKASLQMAWVLSFNL